MSSSRLAGGGANGESSVTSIPNRHTRTINVIPNVALVNWLVDFVFAIPIIPRTYTIEQVDRLGQ